MLPHPKSCFLIEKQGRGISIIQSKHRKDKLPNLRLDPVVLRCIFSGVPAGPCPKHDDFRECISAHPVGAVHSPGNFTGGVESLKAGLAALIDADAAHKEMSAPRRKLDFPGFGVRGVGAHRFDEFPALLCDLGCKRTLELLLDFPGRQPLSRNLIVAGGSARKWFGSNVFAAIRSIAA